MATAAHNSDAHHQPSDCDRVRKFRGCLALCFGRDSSLLAALERVLEQQSGAIPRGFERLPTSQWHITLVTKAELWTLSAAAVTEAEALAPSRVFPIGLGGAAPLGVYFIVCVWPRAQAFRKKHGLPLKDFHVSVSVENNHEIDKAVTALLYVDSEASWMDALGVEALEAVARHLLLEGESKQSWALRVATHLCTTFGAETTRGWLRLGEAALQLHQYKLAMLSFAHAYDRVSSRSFSYSRDRERGGTREDPDAVRQFCLARMQACSAFTEWGQVFVESEPQEIPASLSRFLLRQRWSDALCRVVREYAKPTDRSCASRERVWVVSRMPQVTGGSPYFRLPRFFRWIVPFQLAAMSTPRDEADVVHLARSADIRHVVTLTKEQPLAPDWFPALPNAIVNTFLPVENYEAPSLAQIDLFVKICCESAGVLVHCGGGKGRAGVMVACYLVAFGFGPPPPTWVQPAMAADEAIRALRAIRPGSVETERQEAIVTAYSSLLWKRRSVLPVPVEEPMASKPIVSGDAPERTDLLVLCGLPGSGKTTFRRMLAKRAMAAERGKQPSASRWLELSGDEHGREGCERSLGLRGVQRAILDRVNGKREDRRAFLEIARTWSQHATAVWFDFEADVCVYRAQQRANHPTLAPGRRVENAVAQHSQEFTAPALAEGFATIVRVTSLEAARDLAETLAPPLGLLRFPRTSHVINLGAATADDLVMADMPASSTEAPGDEIVVTEKVDGANLGISLAADGWTFVVQNRSHFVTAKSHFQFRKLDAFLESHGAALRSLLRQDPFFPERFILYGEWVAATHSIAYTHLRDLFYAFDLYDRETRRFWDRRSLEAAVALSAPSSGDTDDDCSSSRRERIQLVPKLWSGLRLPDTAALIAMARETRSQFYDGAIEGLYIKWEAPGVGVRHRGKVVRGDFLAGNEHWSKGAIRLNTVAPPGSGQGDDEP